MALLKYRELPPRPTSTSVTVSYIVSPNGQASFTVASNLSVIGESQAGSAAAPHAISFQPPSPGRGEALPPDRPVGYGVWGTGGEATPVRVDSI